jgi:hypothetical protein
MDSFAQQELGHLIRVSWIVLIPLGVLLSLVLYKLAMLLHSLLDFLTIARYELAPAIKDLRLTAEHVEVLSAKAVSGVKSVEEGISATGPALRAVKHDVVHGVESIWSGIRESFTRKK